MKGLSILILIGLIVSVQALRCYNGSNSTDIKIIDCSTLQNGLGDELAACMTGFAYNDPDKPIGFSWLVKNFA